MGWTTDLSTLYRPIQQLLTRNKNINEEIKIRNNRKDENTWESIKSASRTFSLVIRGLSIEAGVGLGVRDGGGVGGGKGWSIGVPYGRCRLKGGLIAAAVGTDEEIGGIINADEEEGGEKNEGFTRFVTRLLLLIASGVSWRATGADAAERVGGGTCGVRTAEETTLGAWENKGMGAEGW